MLRAIPMPNLSIPSGSSPCLAARLLPPTTAPACLSVYNATGILGVSKFEKPESIAIPQPGGAATPTGVVFNANAYTVKGGTTSLIVAGAASQALVATEEGTVVGVSLSDSTATVAYTGSGAVYKGMALSGTWRRGRAAALSRQFQERNGGCFKRELSARDALGDLDRYVQQQPGRPWRAASPLT